MDSQKYGKFDVSDVSYKVVNGQDIKAYVLTPKNISPGKHPIVVKFHGGFFITGKSLYLDWYPQWALVYCLVHSAIIVTGDYRLLPESSGADITRPGVEADLEKVLVHGESAGGTILMVSAFSQPRGFIKAAIPGYPAIILVPKRKHLNSMQPGKIVTEATPPERMKILISVGQTETIHKYYGTAEKHDIWKLLEKADDTPYMLILHGQEDTAVPIEDNVDWVAAARKKFGEGKIKLHIEPGAEHGFDSAVPLETAWLQEALKPITAHWLGLQD